MQTLTPGAHLTSPRRGYVHHGIYAGDGRVIHYAGFNRTLRRGPVEEVPLEVFAGGRGFTVQSWVAPKHLGDAVVARARSRLGENRYGIWSNNCEHFASWCISGEPRSTQVESLAARLKRVAALGQLLRSRGDARSRRVSSAIQSAPAAIDA